MLADFQLPAGQDEPERKLLYDIERFGWHVLKILEDKTGPGFCYSVGLYYTFEHPELLVMGLPLNVGHQLLNVAASQIAKGRVFRARERVSQIAEGFACSFVPISPAQYEQHLGFAIWFYRNLKQPFPALQLVWPDKRGRLPWEPGYDASLRKLQPLLQEGC